MHRKIIIIIVALIMVINLATCNTLAECQNDTYEFEIFGGSDCCNRDCSDESFEWKSSSGYDDCILCDLLSQCCSVHRDLVISNNFNFTGVMCFSGNGVDFLDINGVSQNISISPTKNICVARNSGIAATLNLTLPTASELNNGQVLYISANDINLTLNLIPGSGTIFADSVTATPSSRGIMLTYRQADTTWYQLT